MSPLFDDLCANMGELNKMYWKNIYFLETVVDSKMSFDNIGSNEIDNYIGKPNVTIIDLRDPWEYNSGHIPTAINIPYEDLNDSKNKLSRKDLLIFYCDRGNISLLAARDLLKEGYNIKSLYRGLNSYKGRLTRR